MFRMDPEILRAPERLPDQILRMTEVGCIREYLDTGHDDLVWIRDHSPTTPSIWVRTSPGRKEGQTGEKKTLLNKTGLSFNADSFFSVKCDF